MAAYERLRGTLDPSNPPLLPRSFPRLGLKGSLFGALCQFGSLGWTKLQLLTERQPPFFGLPSSE